MLLVQVGLRHSEHHSRAELEDRGRRLLMSTTPQIRQLYSTGDAPSPVSENQLQSLLYHMSRSLGSSSSASSSSGGGAPSTPTEQLAELGPQFYPNPLLEVGLADLALEVLQKQGGGKRQPDGTRPVLTSNSLLRLGLEHRGKLGPTDLMKRGYKVLQELDPDTRALLQLDDLTTLRPDSPSLQATLRALSKGMTAYGVGNAATLAQIITAGAPHASGSAPASSGPGPRSLQAPYPREWDETGLDAFERQQLQDLAYALIGLDLIAKERGQPSGQVTVDEIINRGRQHAQAFTGDELDDIGTRAMENLTHNTKRALQEAGKSSQGGAPRLLLTLLAQVASVPKDAASVADSSLDKVVAQALQHRQLQGVASPQDLVRLGLLQLGLTALDGATSAGPQSVDQLVNLGAQKQASQERVVALSELTSLGQELLDRASTASGTPLGADDVVRLLGTALQQEGHEGLRLSALEIEDLVQLAQGAERGPMMRMMHTNTAIDVLQEDPHHYRSHAEGPIAFR